MQQSEIISALKQQLLFNCNNRISQPPGVYGGAFGSAILLYCLSKHDSSFNDLAERTLDSILNLLPKAKSLPTICNGTAGVGFGLTLLEKQGYISIEKDSLRALSTQLLYALTVELNRNNFDFLHGACGIIKYFIESFPYNSQDAKTAINIWLNTLLNNTYETSGGLRVSFKQIQHQGYNISLSHGLSSIIVTLSEMHRLDLSATDKTIIQKLLRGYTNYLLSQIDKTHSTGSYTPIFADMDATKSRLAWCYGDLGIALALWKAADTLGDATMKESAFEIFKFSANCRRDKQNTFVRDACICHGSTGVGQCFKWLYSETNFQPFNEAYLYWLEDTFKYTVVDSGTIHYPFYNVASKSFKAKDSLLEGDTGVLLFLLNEDYILNKILLYE